MEQPVKDRAPARTSLYKSATTSTPAIQPCTLPQPRIAQKWQGNSSTLEHKSGRETAAELNHYISLRSVAQIRQGGIPRRSRQPLRASLMPAPIPMQGTRTGPLLYTALFGRVAPKRYGHFLSTGPIRRSAPSMAQQPGSLLCTRQGGAGLAPLKRRLSRRRSCFCWMGDESGIAQPRRQLGHSASNIG